MRVLMTTDAVGGVWQYSLALARGLVEGHGCRVMLACLGEPSERDLAEAVPSGDVELVSLGLKLEWMPDGARDVERSLRDLGRLVETWRPDLLHSNQFCFGALETAVPKVVVAHSDVLSWIAWHRHGGDLQPAELDETLRAYRGLVAAGLAGAGEVVCPSRFMAGAVERIYGCRPRVIHNGLWPDLYYPSEAKGDVAVVAGRLWDEAKRAAVAVQAVEGLPLELRLVGPTMGPSGERAWLPAAANARYRGSRSWEETRAEIARARFFLATSSYEPFGLAALEAALCGCALLANDTPVFRELWDGAALFYRRDDPGDLRLKLASLLRAPEEAERLGSAARQRALQRFTAERMASEYHAIYTLQADGGPPMAYNR